jgi:hypothetical protein
MWVIVSTLLQLACWFVILIHDRISRHTMLIFNFWPSDGVEFKHFDMIYKYSGYAQEKNHRLLYKTTPFANEGVYPFNQGIGISF